jgi:hydroxyacylglutathione hydrolase
MIKLGKRAFS